MDEKRQFANQIREARQRLGLSQSQAAKRWNVPVKTLQSWEQEVAIPVGATLLRLLPLLSSPAPKPAKSSRR